MNIGVILSGCGVYDGAEIQESVFTLLAIAEHNANYVIYAPDIEQHHVVNHITGEEMPEARNAMTEAARIARGDIKPLSQFKASEIDAIVIPGGFGAAKNLTKWAFSGPNGDILPEMQSVIKDTLDHQKPIVGLCMGPTVIAKALEGTNFNPKLTVGTTEESSPYEIGDISEGINQTGATAVMKTVNEIMVDEKNKIITAPCYMMEAGIVEIRDNIKLAIDALFKLI